MNFVLKVSETVLKCTEQSKVYASNMQYHYQILPHLPVP